MAYRLLLDVSSLAYRAFFAVPSSIKDKEGRPVNAVRGYLDMTAQLAASRRPEEIFHAYDDNWRPPERVAAYPGYKASRAEDPEGLPPQFTLLRQVLDAFGFPQAEAPGWEAEDAIGALCRQFDEGDRSDIVTGDRDLIQLVRDPAVRVLFTVRGVSQLAEFDEAGVEAKYGVPPSRYVEFATLRGDPSDGLPGVPGVGETTARALVQASPSLDALIADAEAERRRYAPLQRSPRLRSALREAAPYLAAMKDVVPIRTDVEVRTWQEPRDDGRLDALADEHNLSGPIRRLRDALDRSSVPDRT